MVRDGLVEFALAFVCLYVSEYCRWRCGRASMTKEHRVRFPRLSYLVSMANYPHKVELEVHNGKKEIGIRNREPIRGLSVPISF